MFSIHHGRPVALCLLAMAFSLAVSACMSSSPDDTESADMDVQTGETIQALTGTNKVCSAVVQGNFRDSIVVSQGWSATTCAGWAWSVGATEWQLGCLWENGFNWGTLNGGIPWGNYCNWW